MSGTKTADSTGTPPVGRKLVAVVYADMVGYSRLIGLDDAGTLERLRTLRRDVIDPASAEHGGRIVNTGGDSLLIVFGSIDGAVRCAMKVQQQVAAHDGDQPTDRAVRFRVGINVGDVIPDGLDVHGDVVNVAARLQAECPPGGICVSRAVRDHVGDRLNLSFEELGALRLKNIVRPVEAFVLKPDAVATLPTSVKPPSVHIANEALPLPDKPSIAVLAFTNMSGDRDQEYFSDGIADDIITELSRSRSLFVIARNSSFTYKGHSVDVKQVARELGVRYVVEGSVRRSGDRIRVTAQLIDAGTGNHVWAERYDRSIADIFAVQDEITTAVTGAIGSAVAGAEQRRATRKPPESLDAWEAYMRGQWHLAQGKAADNERAKQFLKQAICLDSAFASPYAALALAYNMDGTVFGTRAPQEAVGLSAIWARKAVEIDPNDADAHAILAVAASWGSNADEVRDHVTLALRSDPNSPTALAFGGSVLLFTGEPTKARRSLTACLRLDPRGPLAAMVMQFISISYYFENDYERAAEEASLAAVRFPDFPLTYRWLAAALGQLGRTEEARVVLHKALELSPDSFNFYVRHRPPYYRNPQDHEHMLDGLRKAGWQG
jgi:adenylate cyclase